jgi:hypothetical protein
MLVAVLRAVPSCALTCPRGLPRPRDATPLLGGMSGPPSSAKAASVRPAWPKTLENGSWDRLLVFFGGARKVDQFALRIDRHEHRLGQQSMELRPASIIKPAPPASKYKHRITAIH